MPRLSANSCVMLSVSSQRLDVSGSGMYLRDCVLDDLLIRHIGLVAHQQLVHALSSIAVDLLEPLLDVVERVHIGDIVDDADAVGTTVVGRCDGTEALLTGGVPLQITSAPLPSAFAGGKLTI